MPVSIIEWCRVWVARGGSLRVCGKRRSRGWFTVDIRPWQGEVIVTCYPRRPGIPWEVVFYDPEGVVDLETKGDAMAGKWIAAAIGKAKKRTKSYEGSDPVLFKNRPAVQEFMTELSGPGGEVRETSVLMVACSDDGFRVGLKDDDAGGWLWRTGTTMLDALDAIEKALQTGEAKFTSAAARGGKKR